MCGCYGRAHALTLASTPLPGTCARCLCNARALGHTGDGQMHFASCQAFYTGALATAQLSFANPSSWPGTVSKAPSAAQHVEHQSEHSREISYAQHGSVKACLGIALQGRELHLLMYISPGGSPATSDIGRAWGQPSTSGTAKSKCGPTSPMRTGLCRHCHARLPSPY